MSTTFKILITVWRRLRRDHQSQPGGGAHELASRRALISAAPRLKDASTGRLLMKRALDFRNDAEEPSSRVIDYLILDMRTVRLVAVRAAAVLRSSTLRRAPGQPRHVR